MFERFTSRARRTVVLAQEEARLLQHNYIGTEHILLGLLGERESIGSRVLEGFGITREEARKEVAELIGPGKNAPKGHIPFTPRAKKTLELALREALALHHNYIGTEHILLGLIREGDGVAAQILRKHADLFAIRAATLDAVPHGEATSRRRAWALRRLLPGVSAPSGEADPFEEASAVAAGQAVLSASPAADTTLSEAMRLAGAHPVGSHHLLLATLADSNSTAARVLAQLGVDLDQAKEALRGADVTGTSDEQPEDAGRRQMVIEVTDELVTIVAADPVLVKAGNEALRALGGEAPSGEAPGDKASSGKASSGKASPAATIRGRDLRGPEADSLAKAWQALSDTFEVIQRTAAARQATGDAPGDSAPGDDAPEGKKGSPGEPGEPGAATTG